jgi:hypothetical protein
MRTKKHVRPVAKKKQADYILEQIQQSTVFGKKERNCAPSGIEKPGSYRSDDDRPKIPSYAGRKHNTLANQKAEYSGELELSVGIGYNKGGMQTLLKSEIRDAGKKTSQLEENKSC